MEFVQDVEEQWDQDWLQECDKAWDAIHRCLTDGKLEYGESPMHKCILGKRSVHEGDEYIISFLEPPEVKEVAAAIKSIDLTWMRKKYDAITDPDYEVAKSEDDFEYTWAYFEELRDFFQKVAAAERSMLFSVDQ